MSNHPGDPRADANGEIPFDMAEYPYHTYTPPAAAPAPGNVNNFIPNRGQVLHGVQLTRDPDADTARDLPHVSEQIAMDKAVDQTVTPRDLVPIKPIPVTIVDRPDLLRRRPIRATNYALHSQPLDTWFQVAAFNQFRSRLIVSTASADTTTAIVLAVSFDNSSPDDLSAALYRGGADTRVIVDTEATAAVWIKVKALTGGGTSYVSVVQEYAESNGDPLL